MLYAVCSQSYCKHTTVTDSWVVWFVIWCSWKVTHDVKLGVAANMAGLQSILISWQPTKLYVVHRLWLVCLSMACKDILARLMGLFRTLFTKCSQASATATMAWEARTTS